MANMFFTNESLKAFVDEIKTYVIDKISTKANTSHSHKISDISNLQSTLDNKASSSHGTHVSYSTTAPLMDGTSSVGTASTVSRSDHRHPTDTSRVSKTEFDTHDSNTTKHVTSTERTNWNTAKTHADSSHAPSNAEKNQNAFSNIKVGTTTISADTTTDTLELVGNNVTITPDATNDKVTISVAEASTNVSGIVKLVNSTSSTSTTTAATPNSVKSAYDLANQAKSAASSAQTTADSKANATHNHKVSDISDLTATATELNYMDGVTSNVQNQLDTLTSTVNGKANTSHTHTIANVTNLQNTLDGKQATITGGASTIVSSNLTANRALISNDSGKVAVSSVTSTELGYLDGVTSSVQTQLDGKSNSGHTHSYAGSSSVGGVATSANKLATARTIGLTGDVSGSTSFDGSGNVSITTTVADDSHNHIISNIDNLQTTLNGKLSVNGGTVGALTGSSTIVANGTLSGNLGTQTPFSTTTDLYYINKKLTWNNNSYLQHVILLFPVLTSTNWFGYNYIDGEFLCWKNGGNVYDKVEINANCVYNSLRYHLEYFGDNPSWGLCICKYNGVSYYALNCPYHANPYTNVEFVGHIRSDLTGGTSTVSLPLDVPYYNENTSTVLNEEVKNSITDTLTTTIVTSASGTPLYSKNGFVGSLTGNATTATTATKLGSSTVGSATQPIYLNNGTATACTYTLGKSVPSDAKFTDTVYTHPSYTARTGVPTANATLTHGGTFTVTQPVCDATGHVTAMNTRTYTLPADNNTDTKVTNTLATTTKAYVTGTTSATTNTGTQVFDTGVYLDTTAGKLTATTFNGTNFSGSGVATLAEVKSYLGI